MRSVVTTLTVLALLAGAAPVSAQGQAGDETAALLAVATATSGSFSPDADGQGELVLDGVYQATWFTDRPSRRAGVFSVDALSATFFDDEEPPNAALQVLADADVDHDVVILTISDPRYDAAAGTLSYHAVVIPTGSVDPDSSLVDHVSRADASVPTDFGRAVLFIDSASDPFVMKCQDDGGWFDGGPTGWSHACTWRPNNAPYESVRALKIAYSGYCEAGQTFTTDLTWIECSR